MRGTIDRPGIDDDAMSLPDFRTRLASVIVAICLVVLSWVAEDTC